MSIDFLNVTDVLYIHSDQVRLYGGEDGVRDIGLLESAIAQAQISFDGVYLCNSIYEMAAAYMFHIVQNHPFIDGNKRVGVVASLIFLSINGIELAPPPGSLYSLTIGVATGKVDKTKIAEFFRLYTQ